MRNTDMILQGLFEQARNGVVTPNDRLDAVRKLVDALFEEEDSQRLETYLKLLPMLGEVEELREDVRAAERVVSDRKKTLAVKDYELMNICPHECTQWFPDPSGNNDDTTECLICGKEW